MDDFNNSCYGGTCNNNGTPDNTADDTFTAGTAEKEFEGHYLDLGYNVGSLLPGDCNLAVWTRMSAWDANTKVNSNVDTGEVSKSLFGVTWWPNDNVSFKMTTGSMETTWDGGGKKESDIMNIGVGYMF